MQSGDQLTRVHGEPLTFTYEHYFTPAGIQAEVGRAGLTVAYVDRVSSVLVLTK